MSENEPAAPFFMRLLLDVQTSREQPPILGVLGKKPKVPLSLFFFYMYYSKNEEDLERSHDMLQRELRALLEMEGKKRLILTNEGCVSTRM